MKTPAWSQVALCLGLVAALITAEKFLPGDIAHVVQLVGLVFAFFKDPNPPSPPTVEELEPASKPRPKLRSVPSSEEGP